MAKQIIYDSDVKRRIGAGAEKLKKAVACTLGPCGKNVIIGNGGFVHSTKDGVTVARSVVLEDVFENMGASAIKEVAEKSNQNVGDGTTTSTVLATTVLKNGLERVSNGSNATFVKNGIKKAASAAVEVVEKMSKPVSGKDDIRRVARISANGDDAVGEIISDVMEKIGTDGTIKIEEGNGLDVTNRIVEGMVIDQSYASPYMVTKPETMEAELEEPFILLCDKKIANIQEFLPCLQAVAKTGHPLFVMAESYQDDILATLIMTSMRGGLKTVAVNSPSYGENRRAILGDIAALTGGRVVTEATGTRLENACPESGILGRAKRIVVNRENTVIIGGHGDRTQLARRIESIKTQIASTSDELSNDRDKLRERLAKLTSGIGIISVGAATEAERRELRDRVDDAFCAAKAATRRGIVPGGGVALFSAKKLLENTFDGPADERIGFDIFVDALDSPIRHIIENAGLNPDDVINGIPNGAGYDVAAKIYVDMVEAGIIDPTEVVVNEIQNAASIAGLLLTTECMIADIPDKA